MTCDNFSGANKEHNVVGVDLDSSLGNPNGSKLSLERLFMAKFVECDQMSTQLSSLGKSALVLVRGHGATIAGSSMKEVVYRAIYATINANLKPITMQLGEPTFLNYEKVVKIDELHFAVLNRPWDYGKK